MTTTYISKLGIIIWKTNIRVNKIDKLFWKTYSIAIKDFQPKKKLTKIQLFEKTFILANISIKILLEICFFIFCKLDIYIHEKNLF